MIYKQLKHKKYINNISFHKTFIFILLNIVFLYGCMGMGMRITKITLEPVFSKYANNVKKVNTGNVIDKMLDEIVLDLSKQNFKIKSVAVWQIRSKTAGIDTEVTRQKFISRLINLKIYDVVSRKRLENLLEEQSLSLSGAIDKNNVVEIGKLIGVESFIDGYISIKNDILTLSFSLIETKSGKFLWAKTSTHNI